MSIREKNKHLWVITGPTASGKTSLAIQLATYLTCEIINFDSRQFYGDLKIGAALPNDDQLALVKHHFIATRKLDEAYSAGKFATDAENKAQELWQKNNHIVAVGGSGLYLKAWLGGLDDFPIVSADLRENLNERYQNFGIEYLQNLLLKLDPVWYKQVALQNPQRLLRALEVCETSGLPYSSFLGKKKSQSNDFCINKIAINWPREVLYNRINLRAEQMKEEGLLLEAQKVYPYRGHYALNTVGYKELFDFIDSKTSEIEAWNHIKQNTRRYAKRQLTWFKADKEILWLEDNSANIESIINKFSHQ